MSNPPLVHPVVTLLMRTERAWADHDTAWARAQILAQALLHNGHLADARFGPGGTVLLGRDDTQQAKAAHDAEAGH